MTDLNRRATELLLAIGDSDADADAPHLVMVSDPGRAPGFRDFYGPYDTALLAAAAVETICNEVDPGAPARPIFTYTVHPLRPAPAH